MTHYEMVELLREKANVTYEQAKAALEKSDWDLLDAIVLLEREGKTMNRPSSYSTRPENEAEEEPPKRSEFKDGVSRVGRWIVKVIDIGNRNSFAVSRRDHEAFSLPVTAFGLLLVFAFPFTAIALVIGLFTGFRYSFRGPQLGNGKVNNVMDKASDIADNVKAEFAGESKNDEQ